MDTHTIIKIGGFYNLAFLVFHAMFWKLFKWKKDLPFVFFSFRRPASIAMTILFLLGFGLYAYPVIRIGTT